LDEYAIYFLIGAGVWLALQFLALWTMRGLWRAAAWLSAAAMGLATVIATLGVLAGSNIAPIWVIFALPACFGWIVLLWVLYGLARLIVR
jgi:hypothetical protein